MTKQILSKLINDPTAYRLYGYILLQEVNGRCVINLSEASRVLGINRFTLRSSLKRLTHHTIITQTSHKGDITVELLGQDKSVEQTRPIASSSQTHHKPEEEKESTKEREELYISSLRSDTKGREIQEKLKPKTPISQPSKHPHTEIIAYCRDKQGMTTNFVNYVKQTTAVKKILSSGYTLDDIRFVIDEMAGEDFWKSSPFDLMNVANNMHKYMNRTVMYKPQKKGGKYAYN